MPCALLGQSGNGVPWASSASANAQDILCAVSRCAAVVTDRHQTRSWAAAQMIASRTVLSATDGKVSTQAFLIAVTTPSGRMTLIPTLVHSHTWYASSVAGIVRRTWENQGRAGVG